MSIDILEYFKNITDWSKTDIIDYENEIIFCRINPFYRINLDKKQKIISIRYNDFIINEFLFIEKPLYRGYNKDHDCEFDVNGFIPIDRIMLFKNEPIGIIRDSLRYKVFTIVNLIHHWNKLDVYDIINYERKIESKKLQNAIIKIEDFFQKNNIVIIDGKDKNEIKTLKAKEELLHKEIAKKGGIERHKTTNIIKNEIIYKMFEKISGHSINQKATNLNNKINEALNKNEFEKLAKQYDISIQLTKEIKEYLKKDHFEQIYKWCLNFNKNKK